MEGKHLKFSYRTQIASLKHPVGGKTAPEVVSVLKKNVVFAIAKLCETTDSFSKIGLKFPGKLKCFFDDDL